MCPACIENCDHYCRFDRVVGNCCVQGLLPIVDAKGFRDQSACTLCEPAKSPRIFPVPAAVLVDERN